MLKAGAITFVNAALEMPGCCSLRVEHGMITSLGLPPEAGDHIVDLRGGRVLPGLINAHDHLQLNSLPQCDFGKHYPNARDWIADVDARRRSDRSFEEQVRVPRPQRLLIGGLKNLLSGVTTVAHHDPIYSELTAADFPVRIVSSSGWAHSLGLDGPDTVRRAYLQTPPEWPWVIHAAEGVDEEARRELSLLEGLGCLGSNTLLVHGVALDAADQLRLERAGAGLIWCPASNLTLFGRTAEVEGLIRRRRVALGTDSRLSGAWDLLDELRIAEAVSDLSSARLEEIVTRDAAALLRLPDRGVLRTGALADLVVLPAGARLSRIARSDLRLVMIDGVARYGDSDLCLQAAPDSSWGDVVVDGHRKSLPTCLIERLRAMRVRETGLETTAAAWRAA